MANYLFLIAAVCLSVLLPTVTAQNGTHHQYCFVCETIINVAKHEHPKDINALHKLLDKECKDIASFFHDTKKCLEIFNNGTNLQTIWTMLQNDTHAKAICAAIDMCDRNQRHARSAMMAEPIIAAGGHQYCFVCETIVNVAKHEHPKDIDALHKLLDKECKDIASFFHDTKKCLEIFNNGTNLQTIWTMLQNDSHAKAICSAIDMCDKQFEEWTATHQKIDATLCAQCQSATRDFKYLSKSGLSEELQGLCSAATDEDCSGTAIMDIDLLYTFYQAVGDSNAACYHLNIC